MGIANRFISINEFCEIYKIKRSTAYKLVETMQIPHYRIGRLIRFNLEELEEWMEGKKVEPVEVPYDKVEGF